MCIAFAGTGEKHLWDPQKHPDYMLPDGTGWEWDGEWTLDLTGTDSEGWLYSFNFVRTPLQRMRGEDIKWYRTCNTNVLDPTFVRRRKWVRRAINTAKFKQAGGLLPTTTDVESHSTPSSSSRTALSDLLEGRGVSLPKDVSVQYLQTAGGGTALEGHLYKEGRGWPRTWEARYFVLWPKRRVVGRQLGFEHEFQLLFYFRDIDSTSASGVGMVVSRPSVAVAGRLRSTSTNWNSDSMFMQTLVQMGHYSAKEAKQRHGFDCRNLIYDEIVAMKTSPSDGTVRPETKPRVLKIGVPLATAAGRLSGSSPAITGNHEIQAKATVSDMGQWERALIGERVCLPTEALSTLVEWKYEGASGYNPLRWSKKPLVNVVTDRLDPATKDRPVQIRFPDRPDSRSSWQSHTFEKPTWAAKWLLLSLEPELEPEPEPEHGMGPKTKLVEEGLPPGGGGGA